MTTQISKFTNPLDTINIISEKIRSILGDVQNYKWKTNAKFSYSPNSSLLLDISVITNIEILLQILGFLITKQENYDKAIKYSGLEQAPICKWLTYPVDSWIEDVNARIHMVTHHEKISYLENIKKELSEFVSEEDRKKQKQIELEKKLQELNL